MRVAARAIRAAQLLLARLGTIRHILRRARPVDERRVVYQRAAMRHTFTPGQRVLDVGSGGDPFSFATCLADRYIEPTTHRTAAFRREGKPVVICDVSALPFRNHAFDYVVCSHVLEHVPNPAAACAELQRIASSGFIETPTRMKDVLFSWARGMHRWHVVAMPGRLQFFEYTDRELSGLRSTEWRDLILGPFYHPMQDVFAESQDVFNVLFEWQDRFDVLVFRLDGTIEPNVTVADGITPALHVGSPRI